MTPVLCEWSEFIKRFLPPLPPQKNSFMVRIVTTVGQETLQNYVPCSIFFWGGGCDKKWASWKYCSFAHVGASYTHSHSTGQFLPSTFSYCSLSWRVLNLIWCAKSLLGTGESSKHLLLWTCFAYAIVGSHSGYFKAWQSWLRKEKLNLSSPLPGGSLQSVQKLAFENKLLLRILKWTDCLAMYWWRLGTA